MGTAGGVAQFASLRHEDRGNDQCLGNQRRSAKRHGFEVAHCWSPFAPDQSGVSALLRCSNNSA
jgi:hypothetical protein